MGLGVVDRKSHWKHEGYQRGFLKVFYLFQTLQESLSYLQLSYVFSSPIHYHRAANNSQLLGNVQLKSAYVLYKLDHNDQTDQIPKTIIL